MRFDWYQSTVPENPIVLAETLKSLLANDGEIVEGRGRHNYNQSFTIRNAPGDAVAVILAGGKNGDPNVTASGDSTEPFVRVLREHWPDHRVTRFDVASDMIEKGAFEAAETVCRRVAKARGVKGRSIVPDDVSEGRTYYLGAPSSDVRVRLYDKTAESRRKLPADRAAEIPEFWARLEVQVRPRKEFKYWASKMGPECAWGFAGWTAELAKQVLQLEVMRTHMQAAKETDEQRTYRFMLHQYGRALMSMHRDLGSWECVGKTIGDDLAKLAAKRQRG